MKTSKNDRLKRQNFAGNLVYMAQWGMATCFDSLATKHVKRMKNQYPLRPYQEEGFGKIKSVVNIDLGTSYPLSKDGSKPSSVSTSSMSQSVAAKLARPTPLPADSLKTYFPCALYKMHGTGFTECLVHGSS